MNETTDRLVRLALVALAVLLLAPLVVMLLAMLLGGWPTTGGWMMGPGGGWGGPGGWMMGTGGGGAWWWLGGLLWLLGLIAVVALASGVLRGAGGEGEDSALVELRRAYARGDLTDEEYERRRERLGGA
ncbi:SHOCT domain-containing protein [Halomarina pelagica]|uniref:SHOCT domain-containing protein n=1 Tax=Halomarina pelagica TaxID=2961599 RepID=UPI0020C4F8FF|nr:SHOCT domain-containing protein [Halomarina sp. BND7]